GSAWRGYANYGYCASHSRYFWGFKLYLLTTPDGLVVDWCLADPKLGEAEVAEALLDGSPLEEGQIIVCDKGFADRFLQARVAELGATLLRPDRKDEPARYGSLGEVRQWIESIIDTLKGQLSLEEHGGRTPAGVMARVAQRLLALGAAVWWNWQIGAPEKRSLVAYGHWVAEQPFGISHLGAPPGLALFDAGQQHALAERSVADVELIQTVEVEKQQQQLDAASQRPDSRLGQPDEVAHDRRLGGIEPLRGGAELGRRHD